MEFDADNKLPGKVLFELAYAPIKPEFRIVYTIKDKEAAKNELLGKAINDSKEKAKVLATAADVVLGEIQMIDYSWGEIEFVSHPMARGLELAEPCCCEDAAYDIDIEPDDIDVTDTVTVIWTIK